MTLARVGARPGCPALLALLALLGAAACAAPQAALRAPPASSKAPPLVLGELREPHPEPELVSARHRVAPGETLYRIALAYNLSPEELAEANGIDDPRSLSVGQELVLPGVEPPVPVPPKGSQPAAPGKPRDTREARDTREVRDTPPSGPRPTSPRPVVQKPPARPAPATRGTLDWPLKGVLYGRFGKKGREPHDGIDLAVPAGTPVKTAQEGEVLYAGEQRGYGLIIIVQHSERLITLYAHNQELRVRTGQKVRRGQVIATVGESGKTSGPQLHFEVRVDGKPVDPLDYLGTLPAS